MSESAMSVITRHPLYYAARAECERRGITDMGDFYRVLGLLSKDQCLREIEPWNRHRATIYNFKSPAYTVAGGKVISSEYQFSESEKESLRIIDEAIAEIFKKYELKGSS